MLWRLPVCLVIFFFLMGFLSFLPACSVRAEKKKNVFVFVWQCWQTRIISKVAPEFNCPIYCHRLPPDVPSWLASILELNNPIMLNAMTHVNPKIRVDVTCKQTATNSNSEYFNPNGQSLRACKHANYWRANLLMDEKMCLEVPWQVAWCCSSLLNLYCSSTLAIPT